jgi:hypothetical protein
MTASLDIMLTHLQEHKEFTNAKKQLPSARIERAILSLHSILVIRFTTKPRGRFRF